MAYNNTSKTETLKCAYCKGLFVSTSASQISHFNRGYQVLCSNSCRKEQRKKIYNAKKNRGG